MPFALPTGGTHINALLLTAAGAGRHPTVILFHGLPGNEENMDIARAIQRSGWNVLTLHYRGSWGSPGKFTYTHCLEDAHAAILWLRDVTTPAASHIDRGAIVLIGHSLGGFVAGYTVAHEDGIKGLALISTAKLLGASMEGRTKDEATKVFEVNIRNHEGMRTLGDATAEELADELMRNGASWDLKQFAPNLAKQPLLVITADDGFAAAGERLASAVSVQPGAAIARAHFATNHGYDDQRVALTATILTWLAGLPAPVGSSNDH